MKKAVALAGLVASLAGCSLLFQTTLPDNYKPTIEPRCDTGKGLPVVDMTFAILNGLALLGSAKASDPDSKYLVSFGVDAVLYLTSSLIGFGNAEDCEKAQARWDKRRARRDREEDDRSRDPDVEELRRERDRAKQEIERRDREDLERLRREERERKQPIEPPVDAGTPFDDVPEEAK